MVISKVRYLLESHRLLKLTFSEKGSITVYFLNDEIIWNVISYERLLLQKRLR